MRDQFSDEGIVLDNAIGFRVYRANQLFRAALYRLFRADGHEMTPEQWIVLVRLWQRDGQSQTELGDSTLKDKATLSRILTVMEREGLVVRRPDPEDSRGRRIYATRKTRRLQEDSRARIQALVRGIEDGIPERDLEITRRTLLRLETNLRRLEQSK
jgi:DNA-binding MarR family transcriptional regulator